MTRYLQHANMLTHYTAVVNKEISAQSVTAPIQFQWQFTLPLSHFFSYSCINPAVWLHVSRHSSQIFCFSLKIPHSPSWGWNQVFQRTKWTLLKQEQAERNIFNIYFQKMKRICFQCGKLPPPPPPPLCLLGVRRQSGLANFYKSIINMLKYEPSGHNGITWRHIHKNFKQTAYIRNNCVTMSSTFVF